MSGQGPPASIAEIISRDMRKIKNDSRDFIIIPAEIILLLQVAKVGEDCKFIYSLRPQPQQLISNWKAVISYSADFALKVNNVFQHHHDSEKIKTVKQTLLEGGVMLGVWLNQQEILLEAGIESILSNPGDINILRRQVALSVDCHSLYCEWIEIMKKSR